MVSHVTLKAAKSFLTILAITRWAAKNTDAEGDFVASIEAESAIQNRNVVSHLTFASNVSQKHTVLHANGAYTQR